MRRRDREENIKVFVGINFRNTSLERKEDNKIIRIMTAFWGLFVCFVTLIMVIKFYDTFRSSLHKT